MDHFSVSFEGSLLSARNSPGETGRTDHLTDRPLWFLSATELDN